jgi:hypothetical protein
VQREIERLRAMEQPYNIVKEAMEAARLPNDQHITMDPAYIGVSVTATPADSLSYFESLAEMIGQRLVANRMHKDGMPATRHGGCACCLWFTWRCEVPPHKRAFQARLYVALPISGLTDCDVIECTRTSVDIEYEVRRKEPATYRAPEGFTTGFPTTAELARIEADLGAAGRPFLVERVERCWVGRRLRWCWRLTDKGRTSRGARD